MLGVQQVPTSAYDRELSAFLRQRAPSAAIDGCYHETPDGRLLVQSFLASKLPAKFPV